jgi:predicted hotdog family 3-hydroxylacyl-ACP dehydratase
MIGHRLPAVAELLPHGPPMVLLDEMVEDTENSLTTALTIRPKSQFAVAGHGVPAHVAIEYMAQTCGAFAGLEAHRTGQPVRLGFLLGTRRYLAFVPWLLIGWRLTVTATVVFREGQMGVFDCLVRHEAAEIATAQITVYQPDDPASVTGRSGLRG